MAQTLAVDMAKGAVYLFANKRQAESIGNHLAFPANAQEMEVNTSIYPTRALVALYNNHSGKEPIKRFETRQKAVARIWPMLQKIAEVVPDNGKQERVKANKGGAEKAKNERIARAQERAEKKLDAEREAKKKKATTNGSGELGLAETHASRGSSFSGKKLFAKTTENERRFGSHGYDSFQILLDNPGITYEDYLARGGRLKDLAWDSKYERVRLETANAH